MRELPEAPLLTCLPLATKFRVCCWATVEIEAIDCAGIMSELPAVGLGAVLPLAFSPPMEPYLPAPDAINGMTNLLYVTTQYLYRRGTAKL